jgi:ribose-phosphate pyrophosphokinase
MIRGHFHLFACRSGQAYSEKLVTQLKNMLEMRSTELANKAGLTLHEINELQFITNIREDGAHIGKSHLMRFDDGEMNVLIDPTENVRDKDVFLVQCHYNTDTEIPISENLMETFLYLDALRRSKVASVTLVSLYYPYGRGDKQHAKDGVPAKLLATLLTSAGADSLITMDLHADQITGFFDASKIRIEHLYASPLMIEYLKGRMGENANFAAPDVGAAKRTQFFAQALQKKMIMAYKKRSYEHKHTVSEVTIIGLPDPEEVVIIDDIVSTGGSVLKVIEKLKEKGVKKVRVVCTHPLLIGNAVEKFEAAFRDPENPFSELIGTDAIAHGEKVRKCEWYTEIDTSKFMAKAIYEMHTSGSLSRLRNAHCVSEMGLWAGTRRQ